MSTKAGNKGIFFLMVVHDTCIMQLGYEKQPKFENTVSNSHNNYHGILRLLSGKNLGILFPWNAGNPDTHHIRSALVECFFKWAQCCTFFKEADKIPVM